MGGNVPSMPGNSNHLTLVGVLACIVAVVGYVAFGWRFGDGTANPIAIGIALVAVAIAIGSTVQRRL